MHTFFRHILLGEHLGDFFCAVVAIVEENHHIAFLDTSIHGAIHHRLHEFVGNAFVIRILHGLHHVVGRASHAVHELVVSQFHAVPTFIAVHSIVATSDSGNHTCALCEVIFHILNKALAAFWVGVTTVHEAVEIHFFKTIFFSNVAKRKQVVH